MRSTTLNSSQPTRQKVVGIATREATARRVVDAAMAEFRERGYVGATMSRVAARAGVTVQTVYSAGGSKRDLLRAALQQVLNPSPPGTKYPDALEGRFAGMDPAARLRGMAGMFRVMAEQAAPFWDLYRDAAATDVDLAEDWRDLQTRRRDTLGRLIDPIPADCFHVGLTRQRATDTAWALIGPDSWHLLVRVGGRTPQQFQEWLTTALVAALLQPGDSQPGTSPS